jgi:hypothetical protein
MIITRFKLSIHEKLIMFVTQVPRDPLSSLGATVTISILPSIMNPREELWSCCFLCLADWAHDYKRKKLRES